MLTLYVCPIPDCGRLYARPQSSLNDPNAPDNYTCPQEHIDHGEPVTLLEATMGFDPDRNATTITILDHQPSVPVVDPAQLVLSPDDQEQVEHMDLDPVDSPTTQPTPSVGKSKGHTAKTAKSKAKS